MAWVKNRSAQVGDIRGDHHKIMDKHTSSFILYPILVKRYTLVGDTTHLELSIFVHDVFYIAAHGSLRDNHLAGGELVQDCCLRE